MNFINSLSTSYVEGCGWLESFSPVLGPEVEYTLYRSPVNLRADTLRQSTVHAYTHTYRKVLNSIKLCCPLKTTMGTFKFSNIILQLVAFNIVIQSLAAGLGNLPEQLTISYVFVTKTKMHVEIFLGFEIFVFMDTQNNYFSVTKKLSVFLTYRWLIRRMYQ